MLFPKGFLLFYATSSPSLTPNIIPLKIRHGEIKLIDIKQIGIYF